MKKLLPFTVLPSLFFAPHVLSDSYFTGSTNDSFVEAGDMLTIMLPATGLFASWMYDDFEGTKQVVFSTATTQLIIEGTKQTVGRKRPNGSGWKSFPSGHAGGAFSGAAFLQSRYGAAWGIPAYSLATVAAVSRVHGNRHYVGDVVGGASIAFLVNQFFVSPYQAEGVKFSAEKTDDGYAVGVRVSNDAFDQERDKSNVTVFQKKLKHRFELGIGANLSDSSGQVFADRYLETTDVVDESQPFAYINYQYTLENFNELEIEFLPFETRRTGVVKEAFVVDGYTFNPGDEVYTAYQHAMLGSNVYKGFKPIYGFDYKVGLGMYVHRVGLVAEDANKDDSTVEEDHWRAMVSGTAKGNYSITDDFSLLAKFQYHFWEDDTYMLAEAGINYAINHEWDVGFKYGYSESKFKDANFSAEYDADTLVLTFANRF
ncbi:MAG: phosphatase PAP2 family protein [Psychromonas sp.]